MLWKPSYHQSTLGGWEDWNQLLLLMQTVTGSNEDTDVQQYINTFNQSIERGCYKNKERDRDQKRTGDLAVG